MQQIAELDKLIKFMIITPVYTQNQLEELWEQDRVRIKNVIERMLETGEAYGVASGGPDFLNQSEEKFRQYLKKTDNDLG